MSSGMWGDRPIGWETANGPDVLECGTCECREWKKWLGNQITDLECQVKTFTLVAISNRKPLRILTMEWRDQSRAGLWPTSFLLFCFFFSVFVWMWQKLFKGQG